MIPHNWTKDSYNEFILYLKSLGELHYKDFQSKLVFTKYEMLGIRIPILRKIAKEISKTDFSSYFNLCQDKYYEEVMIEGFVIASIKNENQFDEAFFEHIKKIDDWSLCDSFCNSLKRVNKNESKYFGIAKDLSLKEEEFISRVGLITILAHFVKQPYIKEIFCILNNIKSDKYYINMAEAWLICELYIKFPKETEKYLKNNKLNNFTQNKAISKIRDSYRIPKEEKDYLNTLKRK